MFILNSFTPLRLNINLNIKFYFVIFPILCLTFIHHIETEDTYGNISLSKQEILELKRYNYAPNLY